MMIARLITLLVFATLLVPVQSVAENVTLEVTEAALNKIVDPYRLGVLSGRGSGPAICSIEVPTLFEACDVVGFFRCPPGRPGLDMPGGLPDPGTIPMAMCVTVHGGRYLVPTGPAVPWRYWISSWHFATEAGRMRFRATVESDVSSVRETQAGEVDARVVFDSATGRLRVVIDPFRVTLKHEGCPVVTIDVAEKFNFAIPIETQRLSVPVPEGNNRTVNARVRSVAPQYFSGRVMLNVDVEFF